jgi:predicted RNA-binding Zn-ribbon protein involved in translation (DUF1610 family)
MSGFKFSQREVVKGYEEPVTRINRDVCCAMCETVLLRTVQIKEIPEENMYKFTCPTCGGKSFINNFSYKTFFEPVNCSIKNIEKDGEIWVVQLSKN